MNHLTLLDYFTLMVSVGIIGLYFYLKIKRALDPTHRSGCPGCAGVCGSRVKPAIPEVSLKSLESAVTKKSSP